MSNWRQLAFALFKWLRHWLTGKSHLERICLQAFHDASAEPETQAVPSCTLTGPLWRAVGWSLYLVRGPKQVDLSQFTSAKDPDFKATQFTVILDAVSADAVYAVDRELLYSNSLQTARHMLEAALSSHANIPQSSIISAQSTAAPTPSTIDGLRNNNMADLYQVHGDIMRIKKFDLSDGVVSAAPMVLMHSILHIRAVSMLVHEMDSRALVKYETSNAAHERRLMELWQLCTNDRKLTARKSTDWQRIGFQGTDPATDFRGMGVLGLDQLLFFAKKYTKSAHYTLAISSHHEAWYTWAIVGINITSYALSLLRSRRLQQYMFYALHEWDGSFTSAWKDYGKSPGQFDHVEVGDGAVIAFLRDHFHDLYCYMFVQFNRRWVLDLVHPTERSTADSKAQRTPAILEFPRIFKLFQVDFEKQLLSGNLTTQAVTKALLLSAETVVSI